jgi:hypothetical protein
MPARCLTSILLKKSFELRNRAVQGCRDLRDRAAISKKPGNLASISQTTLLVIPIANPLVGSVATTFVNSGWPPRGRSLYLPICHQHLPWCSCLLTGLKIAPAIPRYRWIFGVIQPPRQPSNLSTASTCPVMCLPASLANKIAAPFRSSRSPIRRNGAPAASLSAPAVSSVLFVMFDGRCERVDGNTVTAPIAG